VWEFYYLLAGEEESKQPFYSLGQVKVAAAGKVVLGGSF